MYKMPESILTTLATKINKELPDPLPYLQDDLQKLVLIKTNIAGFFFDGFISTQHQLSATVTSHPVQDGAQISDHIYVDPSRITMEIKMSDSNKGSAVKNGVQDQFFGLAYTRSVGAWNVLKQLMQQRIMFQVHTRLDTYQNMVITSLSSRDTLDNLYGLSATVEMEEVLIANVKTVKVTARSQATADSNTGIASLDNVTKESILYHLAKSLGLVSDDEGNTSSGGLAGYDYTPDWGFN